MKATNFIFEAMPVQDWRKPLRHLDNGFYILTARQAKQLCSQCTFTHQPGNQKLPHCGYEKILDPLKLAGVVQLEGGLEAFRAHGATVQRTMRGGKQIWALHLYFSIS